MSEDFKVNDEQTREWMAALSTEDKAELKRQALLKRARSQPEKDVDWGALSDEQFEAQKRKLFRG